MLSRTRNPGAYSYPPNGAARPHAPIAVGARGYSYESNGNMLSDGVKTLTWANDNRLASVTLGANVSAFAYGPDGSRVRKTVTGPLASVTRYFGAEAEEKGGIYTRYPHMDVMVEGSTIKFLHRDHLASVRLVTKMDGTVQERANYAAFGEPKPVSSLPRGYIGERAESVLRLSSLFCIARRIASVVVALPCKICPIVPPSIHWKRLHHQSPGSNTYPHRRPAAVRLCVCG